MVLTTGGLIIQKIIKFSIKLFRIFALLKLNKMSKTESQKKISSADLQPVVTY